MSNITKNWFYTFEALTLPSITIENGIFASLFVKNISWEHLSITLGEDARCDIYGFFDTDIPKNITFIQKSPHSTLKFSTLVLGSTQDLTSEITSHIDTIWATSNIMISSIVQETSIHINSSLHISEASKEVEAHLDLENIFLWEKGSIASHPNLFVDTHDVKVSHSSKTHRLPEEKLFYLESRWLPEAIATQVMLDGVFRRIFACIDMYDQKVYEKLYENFLEEITKKK